MGKKNKIEEKLCKWPIWRLIKESSRDNKIASKSIIYNIKRLNKVWIVKDLNLKIKEAKFIVEEVKLVLQK